MGRIEILTGVERRRRWTWDEKQRIVEEVLSLGYGGVTIVARRHDLHPNQVYGWRKMVQDRKHNIQFLPVEMSPEEAVMVPEEQDTDSFVEVGVSGDRLIRFAISASDDTIRRFIRLAEQA